MKRWILITLLVSLVVFMSIVIAHQIWSVNKKKEKRIKYKKNMEDFEKTIQKELEEQKKAIEVQNITIPKKEKKVSVPSFLKGKVKAKQTVQEDVVFDKSDLKPSKNNDIAQDKAVQDEIIRNLMNSFSSGFIVMDVPSSPPKSSVVIEEVTDEEIEKMEVENNKNDI